MSFQTFSPLVTRGAKLIFEFLGAPNCKKKKNYTRYSDVGFTTKKKEFFQKNSNFFCKKGANFVFDPGRRIPQIRPCLSQIFYKEKFILFELSQNIRTRLKRERYKLVTSKAEQFLFKAKILAKKNLFQFPEFFIIIQKIKYFRNDPDQQVLIR